MAARRAMQAGMVTKASPFSKERVMPDEGFTTLAGRRVALRRFDLGDLAEFVAYRSSARVARFQSWDAPYPREEGERLIRQMMRRHPDTAGQWFQFAVMLRPAGPLIGDCAAVPHADDPRQCEIGFTIASRYQGHGYATEATRLLVGYLFAGRGKHKITASCDARNTASAALLERLGMRREGHLRESTWAKGEWTDDLLYGLLHDEWNTRTR
jgi:RimJ/RimL family protein N-acetyltransferase